MKKLYAYLALLVCVLCAPLGAYAWNFSQQNTSDGPSAIKVHAKEINNDSGWKDYTMSHNSGTWTLTFTARQNYFNYYFIMVWGNSQGSASYGKNTTVNVGTPHTNVVDDGTPGEGYGEQYYTPVESGKQYKITLTASSGNSGNCDFTITEVETNRTISKVEIKNDVKTAKNAQFTKSGSNYVLTGWDPEYLEDNTNGRYYILVTYTDNSTKHFSISNDVNNNTYWVGAKSEAWGLGEGTGKFVFRSADYNDVAGFNNKNANITLTFNSAATPIPTGMTLAAVAKAAPLMTMTLNPASGSTINVAYGADAKVTLTPANAKTWGWNVGSAPSTATLTSTSATATIASEVTSDQSGIVLYWKGVNADNKAASGSGTYNVHVNTPSFAFDKANNTQFTNSGSVKITPTNAVKWWYEVNGTKTDVSSSSAVTINMTCNGTADRTYTIKAGYGSTTVSTYTYVVKYAADSPDMYVYFTNPSNWSTVRVYAYNGGYPASGEAGTWDTKQIFKDPATGLYKWKFDHTAETIIFNKGGYGGDGNQTANLTFVAGHVYDNNGDLGALATWYDNNAPKYVELWRVTSGNNGTKIGAFTKKPDGTWLWYGGVDKADDSKWDSYYFIFTKTKNDVTKCYTVGDVRNYWLTEENTPYNLSPRDYYYVNNNDSFNATKNFLFKNGGWKYVWLTFNGITPATITYGSTAPVKLNVAPREVREGKVDTWTNAAAYITADYLNNNTIAPDWEMKKQSDGSWKIEGVTLRNPQHGSAQITAYLFNPGSTSPAKQVSYTPPTSLIGSSSEMTWGQSFDITVNAAFTSMTVTRKSILPPYIGMLGQDYKQLDVFATPNNYFSCNSDCKIKKDSPTDPQTTSDGWQEAYILYGSDLSPIYDNDKKVIYSTQWPPMNAIKMSVDVPKEGVTNPDKNNPNHWEPFEISSATLSFLPQHVKNEDGEDTEAYVIKTGADWQTDLHAESSVYSGLDSELNASKKYVRYIVNNMWVVGTNKIWTGWGGQIADWGAQWNNNLYFGFAKSTSDANCKINPRTDYTLSTDNDTKNINITEPTYFKTIELFIEVNTDGSGNITSVPKASPVLYTTQSLFEATIKARAAKTSSSLQYNNTGQYSVTFNQEATSGYTLEGFEIYRYNAAGSTLESPIHTDWELIGSTLHNDEPLVAEGTTSPATTGYVTDAGGKLENGVYFYGLCVKYSYMDNGTKKYGEEWIQSNLFTLADYTDFAPSVNPAQLVYVYPDANTKGTGWKSEWDIVKGNYLTYRHERNGSYFVIQTTEDDRDADDNVTTFMEAKTAHALCDWLRNHQDAFEWTARYFVYAFNGAKLAADINSAASRDEVVGLNGTPTVWVAKSADALAGVDIAGGTTNRNGHDLKKATRTQTGEFIVYGRVLNMDGSLKKPTFHAGLRYSYDVADASTETGQRTVTVPATGKFKTNSGTVQPVVPKPYNLTYRYIDDTDLTNNQTPDGRFEAKKPDWYDLVPAEGINFTVPSSITGREAQTVNFEKRHFVSRHLDTEFSFMQPNVEDAILALYDIHYDVVISNNLTAEYKDGDIKKKAGIDEASSDYLWIDEEYHDVTQTTQAEPFTFLLKDVHPATDQWPILFVRTVVYESNSANPTAPEDDNLKAVYEYDNLWIEAENEFVKKPSSLEALYLWAVPGYNDGTTQYYNFLYRGHKEFQDPGESIGDKDNKEATNATLTPSFYMIETYERASNTGSTPATKPHYYTYPYFAKHDGKTYACSKKDPTWKGNTGGTKELDPMYDAVVAKNISTDQPDRVVFVATPVYVFERNPQTELTTTGLETAPGKHQAHAPRRAGEGETMPELAIMTGAPLNTALLANNPNTTGIEDVLYENNDAEAEYYTVSGIRVMEPQPGQVYIVRRGATVTKEYVK